MKIAFYIANFNIIGGIETWIYNIAKIYGEDHNIYVYYTNGDENQVNRLKKLVKVRRFYKQKIDCDVAIFCYTTNENIIKCFNAKKEKVQFIHACYSAAYNTRSFVPSKLIDRYIAVSRVAAEDFYDITGVMPEVIYNPLYVEKPKKLLKLISATRISPDKGSIWEKMKILANKLNEANIPFVWLVFTHRPSNEKIKNVVFMPPELDIINYINEADYLVQLSKTEAFCYSIIEALTIGTPVICTDFPVCKELGVVDGENGFILDMELNNVDVDKIYKGLKKFNYKTLNSNKEWDNLLGEPCKIDKDIYRTVRCINRYGFFDVEYGVDRKYLEEWEVTDERANYLVSFTNPKQIDIIK